MPAIAPDHFPADLPASALATLAPAENAAAAEAVTRQLAHSHYENFSVISLFLPKHLRQDFCNVYAFCRVADDLGDEVGNRARSTELLNWFGELTRDCYAGKASAILFSALAETIRRHQIPMEPFTDLIAAFEQDQTVVRYETFDQVVDYCRRSANPVGRLVLYMSGYRDAERQRLSDKTCTALQLTNFWQDVRRDLTDRDRIYLPRESMDRFGVTENQLKAFRCDDNYRRLIQFEVDRAQSMFDEGAKLLPMLDGSVRSQVSLFGKGGQAILKAIRRQNYDTLSKRPRLSKWRKGMLVLGTLGGYMTRAWHRTPNNRASA